MIFNLFICFISCVSFSMSAAENSEKTISKDLKVQDSKAKGSEVKESKEKQSTKDSPAVPSIGILSVELQVGEYTRTKKDIEEFVKLFMILHNLPESALVAFMKKEYENTKHIYMELLRKKALITGYDKTLWKDKQVLELVDKNMKQYGPLFHAWGVKNYIAKEFFMIQAAYNKLESRFGNFGISISPAHVDFVLKIEESFNHLNQKHTKEYIYVAEAVLDETKFESMEKESLMPIVQLLIKELGWPIFTLAFSKALNAGHDGIVGYVPVASLSGSLKEAYEEAFAMSKTDASKSNPSQSNASKSLMSNAHNQALILKKNKKGHVLYFMIKKPKPALDSDNTRMRLFNSAAKKVFYGLLWTHDGGVINSA